MKSDSARPLEIGRPTVTSAGLAWFWLSLGGIATGVIRYDGALIWLGVVALVVFIVARWWACRNLLGLEIHRRRPGRVFAGELFEVTLRICRTGAEGKFPFRTGCAIEIRDSLFAKEQGIRLREGVANGEWLEGKTAVRWFRRGRVRQTEVSLRSVYPLGLFEVRATGSLVDESMAVDGGMLVYPQPFLPSVLKRSLELERFDLGARHGIEPEPGEEFRGVREYRSGDAVKAIHWPATARAGTLMVREWDPPAPRPARYGLIVHTWEEGGGRLLRPERWEWMLRIAAGVVAYCRENGIALWYAEEIGEESGVSLRSPEACSFGKTLERLAMLRRQKSSDVERLKSIVEKQTRACDRVFVLSDVPLLLWREVIAPASAAAARQVTCLDTESVEPVNSRPTFLTRTKAS